MLIEKFISALEKGKFSELEEIFQEGFDFLDEEYKGEIINLLKLIIERGDIKILEFLLRKGLDPNFMLGGELPLLIPSIISGNYETISLLLKYDADPNLKEKCNGCSPITYAITSGNIIILELLLERGANVNLLINGKYTPLMLAAMGNDEDAMTLLLEYEADPNYEINGITFLDLIPMKKVKERILGIFFEEEDEDTLTFEEEEDDSDIEINSFEEEEKFEVLEEEN
jgi:ankyrin repeat protein